MEKREHEVVILLTMVTLVISGAIADGNPTSNVEMNNSSEEHKFSMQIQKKLKLLNKPAIKTIYVT